MWRCTHVTHPSLTFFSQCFEISQNIPSSDIWRSKVDGETRSNDFTTASKIERHFVKIDKWSWVNHGFNPRCEEWIKLQRISRWPRRQLKVRAQRGDRRQLGMYHEWATTVRSLAIDRIDSPGNIFALSVGEVENGMALQKFWSKICFRDNHHFRWHGSVSRDGERRACKAMTIYYYICIARLFWQTLKSGIMWHLVKTKITR